MSDTDDTEELLLIPPNLFILQSSESEDSIIELELERESNFYVKHSVDNIVENVERLQLRLGNLESVSLSDINTSNDRVIRDRDISVFDCSLKKCSSEKFFTFPRIGKLINCKSMESTPFRPPSQSVNNSLEGRILKSNTTTKKSSNPNVLKNVAHPVSSPNKLSFSSFESESPSDCSVNFSHSIGFLRMDSTNNSTTYSPKKRQDNNMLCDIDIFLDNVNKVHSRFGDPYTHTALQTPMHSTPNKKNNHMNFLLSEEPNRYKSNAVESIPPQSGMSSETVFQNYQQTDCGLNSITNHKVIDKNEKSSPANYLSKYIYLQGQENVENKTELMKCEENIVNSKDLRLGSFVNSVPDLGYGMREIMYSSNEVNTIPKKSSEELLIKEDYTYQNFQNNLPKEHQAYEEKYHDSCKGSYVPSKNTVSFALDCTNLQQIPVPVGIEFNDEIQNYSDFPKQKLKPDAGNTDYDKTKRRESKETPNQMLDCDDNKYTDNNKSQSNINQVFSKSVEQQYCIDLPLPNSIIQNQMLTTTHHSNQVLPSLLDLWKTSNEVKADYCSVDPQKYEEERLRREHCEDVIQRLQSKLLEHQQRLAIAVRVDTSKDEVIIKLREAYVRLSSQLQLSQEKHSKAFNDVNNQVQDLHQEKFQLKEKVKQHESEISKLLNTVQEAQESSKSALIEKEITVENMQKILDKHKELISDKEDRFNELKESNRMVVQLNKQLSDNILNLQNNIEKNDQDVNYHKKKLTDVTKIKGNLEDELSIVKSERSNLRCIISEEKSCNIHLNGQKSKLQESLDAIHKKMNALESEYNSFKKTVETQKNDQKIFYQKQVENIVMNKLSEFQSQLDAAESLMENEMQSKEQQIAIQFAKQLHKIEQQHKLEVGIIEEKHKEEMKLYRIQLAKSDQTIQELEHKLTSYKNKRGQIAAQLHNVMENQWQQALQIITNGSSNSGKQNLMTCQEPQGFQRNQNPYSYSDRPEQDLYAANTYSTYRIKKHDHNHNNGPHCTDNGLVDSEKKISESVIHKQKLDAESSNKIQLADEDLQHYVKALLQKAPGVTECQDVKITKNKIDVQNNMFKHLEEFEYPTSDKNTDGLDRKSDKHSHLKPPWK